MNNTRGGVVYWRRVADQLRNQADEAALAGDLMLRRAPTKSSSMYRLACLLNTAARRVECGERTTPEEHELVRTARARVEAEA